MALASHIDQLERRHRELENQLEEIMAHPSADDVEIAELKRQKLQIKDRIEQLRRESALH